MESTEDIQFNDASICTWTFSYVKRAQLPPETKRGHNYIDTTIFLKRKK